MWELDHKESWALKNWRFWTVVLDNTLESPLDCKEIKPINPKGNQSWISIGRTDTEASLVCNMVTDWPWEDKTLLWCEELTHWKSLWCWERLKAGGEGDDRGWDGWMASPTQWTWTWVNSRSWWWTGKPGVLQSMGSQRVRQDLSDWTELKGKLVEKIGKHITYKERCYKSRRKTPIQKKKTGNKDSLEKQKYKWLVNT